MGAIIIIGTMLLFALVPFALLTWLWRGGRSGLATVFLSVAFAVLAVALYASGRPFGVDPLQAMTVAMLGALPAFLGSLAGVLLGWLLRKRDDRHV